MRNKTKSYVFFPLWTLFFIPNFFYSKNLHADICETHIKCPTGEKCSCTIAATSAYDRYFYFDFSKFKKLLLGKVYVCSFHGIIESFNEQGSKFPLGTSYKCVNCPFGIHFPLELEVNTQNMQQEEDVFIFKYFVPGSDIPDAVDAECVEMDDKNLK